MDKYLHNSMHGLLMRINKQMPRRAGMLPNFIQENKWQNWACIQDSSIPLPIKNQGSLPLTGEPAGCSGPAGSTEILWRLTGKNVTP